MNPETLRSFLTHGSPNPLPARTPLRAGPLSLCFESGDLRYLKFGEREIIRRIYAAVRDRNWGTVPSEISNLKLEIAENRFHIAYTSEHRQGDIHFVWQGVIVGEADGSIRFTFDGEAKTTFLRSRIGFCVLHPIRECAGARCRAEHADGTSRELIFPEVIAPEQPVESLHDLAGLAHEIEPDVWAELRFEGDIFETEDQRNWIDASFKTFCTPLRIPSPVEIVAGTRVRQEIRLSVVDRRSNARISSMRQSPALTVTARDSTRPLPKIGLGWASHGQVLAATEIERLAALHLAHVRVDVRASEPQSSVQLTMACTDSEHFETRIELAVHLDDLSDWQSPAVYLAALRRQLETAGVRPVRMLVFGSKRDKSTPAAALAAAREVFGDFGVPIGAGANADLYQLNLQRPPADADFICWSMNPQVHAFDCASIAETPEAAAQQIASARTYFPGKPLVVSPVTLKPRFNPVATGPEPPAPHGELPPQVDPRQLSLFGAGWTLAMIKALAESGIDSATFHETTGWRGVMETQAGSTLPEKFPSMPETVFPLYHVLADVGEFVGGESVRTDSSDPLRVASLLLRAGSRQRLMLANLSGEPQKVTLEGFDPIVSKRVMDASSVLSAMESPEEFRARARPFQGTDMELGPFALATLDLADR